MKILYISALVAVQTKCVCVFFFAKLNDDGVMAQGGGNNQSSHECVKLAKKENKNR